MLFTACSPTICFIVQKCITMHCSEDSAPSFLQVLSRWIWSSAHPPPRSQWPPHLHPGRAASSHSCCWLEETHTHTKYGSIGHWNTELKFEDVYTFKLCKHPALKEGLKKWKVRPKYGIFTGKTSKSRLKIFDVICVLFSHWPNFAQFYPHSTNFLWPFQESETSLIICKQFFWNTVSISIPDLSDNHL